MSGPRRNTKKTLSSVLRSSFSWLHSFLFKPGLKAKHSRLMMWKAALLPNARRGFIADVELEAIAESLAPRLIAYALARTGCRGTAEDIAQEALTALVVRWRRAGPPESPDAYVFAIAKRRAGRAVARRALMAPLDALRGVARHEPGVEQSYQDRTELAIVLSAIRALSRADREALLLRVAGELRFDEVAVVMHTSPAAVKMRVSRARRKLVAILAETAHGRRIHTA